jgi:hypothetical protein
VPTFTFRTQSIYLPQNHLKYNNELRGRLRFDRMVVVDAAVVLAATVVLIIVMAAVVVAFVVNDTTDKRRRQTYRQWRQ